MNRVFEAITPLPPDVLMFDSLQGREEVSRLFELSLWLKSEAADITADQFLGEPITVKIRLPDGGERFLNGQCSDFSTDGRRGKHYLYRLTLRPWLWHLTQRTDSRIFQRQTVRDIVSEVLQDYPFDFRWQLSRPYRQWEYCVQYRESDANFVMRLLEHEGIWFYFDHDNGQHTLVLCDHVGLADPFPGYERIAFHHHGRGEPADDFIDGFSRIGSVQTGRYSLLDYNFTKPTFLLQTRRELPGDHPHGNYQHYEFPGGYADYDDGLQYSEVRMEEHRSRHLRGHGQGNARGLAPGWLFHLDKHPQPEHNGEYLLLSADYDFADNDYEAIDAGREYRLRVGFHALPTKLDFRPARLTPKPRSHGPDTAVVTGPEGREIFTDEFGRVKVQFHWDRYGNLDGASSCWVRVSHPWAGAGFGAIHIPRIGQEVLVDYLHGDPDRPIITGRVYNMLQRPPWELPANATQSGILSRSLKGTRANANALRFEDKTGEEQVWLHAERNMDTGVENDETHWVGNDRAKTIDNDETVHVANNRTEQVGNDETISIGNNRSEEVTNDETIHIGNNRSETVGANEDLNIAANRNRQVGGKESVSIGQSQSVKIGKNQDVKVSGSSSSTTSKNKMETIGLLKALSVGGAYQTTVGGAMNTTVALMQSEQVGQSKHVKVGKKYSINAGDELEITVGESSLVLKADGTIKLTGKKIQIAGEDVVDVDSEFIDFN